MPEEITLYEYDTKTVKGEDVQVLIHEAKPLWNTVGTIGTWDQGP